MGPLLLAAAWGMGQGSTSESGWIGVPNAYGPPHASCAAISRGDGLAGLVLVGPPRTLPAPLGT